MSARASAALVDTDAFSILFVLPRDKAQKKYPLVDAWRARLEGVRVVIAFQTVAEILAGAREARWGEKRLAQLEEILAATPTVGVDEEVLRSYATLKADCRAVGHGLHAKMHAGDRWIAACAIAKGLPLLSGDGIYRDAPALKLLDDAYVE